MNADHSHSLREAVCAAYAENRPLAIVGGGTKAFYGRRVAAESHARLDTAAHRGIVRYEPAELVLTARCGTPLAEIEALLAEHGQMLPFEPPHFGPGATLGGAVATGLSGPRRPFAGSVRDCVLGCTVLDGQGGILSFGGQVMKNVAGFDVSRLMAGALGSLGVLLEVSLKVLPRPEYERTLVYAMGTAEALAAMQRWCAEPWPVSGLAYDESWVYLRLAGAEAAVAAAERQLGGDLCADGPGFWHRLCEQQARFFQYPGLGRALWRFSVPPAAPLLEVPGCWLYDWGGALRWLKTDSLAPSAFEAAARAGGHATLFRGAAAGTGVFQPLPPALLRLHLNLKRAFDPKGLLNPGRLYEDF